MTSYPAVTSWGFGDLKKRRVLRFGSRGRKSIFRVCRGQTSSLQRELHMVGVRWKSQHSKKLCLSLLMSKNLKLKKVIKILYQNQFRVFSDSYICLWTFVNVFRIFMNMSISHTQIWLYYNLFDFNIPQNFKHILQGRFWFVQISFNRMVTWQFLAQFPEDPLAQPVMPSLTLHLLYLTQLLHDKWFRLYHPIIFT